MKFLKNFTLIYANGIESPALKDQVGAKKHAPLQLSKITTELYDLKTDLGEEKNVADKHPEIVNELLNVMVQSRTPSDAFKFQVTK